MKSLNDHLTQYAAYHQDGRNVATHFLGIPMIVVAVATLLSRPVLDIGGIALTPAWLVSIAAAIFYLRLDLRFGLVMTALLAVSLAIGQWFAAMPLQVWLEWGLGLLILGWIIQFVGHYYEGRKPAFVDDLVGLLVGPLFLVAETAFALGWCASVRDEIQVRLGRGEFGARRAPA